MGLSRTSEAFESEWYELKAMGKLEGNLLVPDIYQRNADLEEEIAALRRELNGAKSIASQATATWDKFRKERDFHRMHHKRVAQEKNKLLLDIKRLKDHFAKYEPTILELKKKYETAMKEKMLISIERDKVAAKIDQGVNGAATQSLAREASRNAIASPSKRQASPTKGRPGAAAPPATQKAATRSGWTTITGPQGTNPYQGLDFPAIGVRGFSVQKTFKGHLLSVANVAIHPTKPVLVTASDDKTWKMWHLPAGDLIMCGEGHKDWVAGVDFHPAGTSLATGSGDSTVKIWDFGEPTCCNKLSL